MGLPLFFAFALYAVLWFTTWGLPETWAVKWYAPAVPGHASENTCVVPRDVVTESQVTAMFPELVAAEGPADTGRYAADVAREFECDGSRWRRLRRVRLAVQIRRRYSPEEQMTMELNLVYFGENSNGIAEASEHYFSKPPEQLDVAQMALLAGMIERPSYFSPVTHPDRALERRNMVLDAMYRDGKLRRIAWLRAKAEPIRFMQ